ncbi:MAG: epimerase [Gaiellaceae bacterium]
MPSARSAGRLIPGTRWRTPSSSPSSSSPTRGVSRAISQAPRRSTRRTGSATRRRGRTFARAVENTRILLRAARRAGVRRVVHVSVTNPREDSPFAYFRGKAAVERDVLELCPSHAIVRPTLVFGAGDLLVNNIAWILRRFPVFLVPRRTGRIQPVAGEDVAALAADLGASAGNETVDAAGPEEYSFDELVRLVGRAVGSRARVVGAPTTLALTLCTLAGAVLRDAVVTRDELEALAAGALVSAKPPRGTRSFAAWLVESAPTLGAKYVSELARNFRSHAPI